MLAKILKEFKKLIFKSHKYNMSNSDVLKLIKISHLTSYKNIYFSMYYNNYFKELLYEFKYRKNTYIKNIIANIIKKDILFLLKKEKIDYIIPVPITKKRLIKRGFNQTNLILDSLNLKYLEIKRIKITNKMSFEKNSFSRKINALNSFDVKNLNLDNKTILIFDDVMTTGATINEITKNLKKEYKNINVLVYCIAVSKLI